MKIQGLSIKGFKVQDPPAPSVDIGTTVAWSSDTYFDSWTSQTATDSDLPISGGPSTTGSGYNTNQLVWQLFYAHQSIELTASSNKWGFVPYASGTNSISLRSSISTVDNTLGSFDTDIVTSTSTSVNYTGDVLNERPVSTKLTVPANRYFLLGLVNGPFYRIFKTLSSNRTAQINGTSIVTVFNRFYHARWTDGPTSGIPTQLGGSGSFSLVTGSVPVLSFKFTTV